jgi:putative NIF3 family GTP cyclohydrolase 1 type 2
MPLARFAGEVRKLLGQKVVRVVGSPDRFVEKVALCGGSGMAFLPRALEVGADVYLTGDVKHHEALEAMGRGIAVVDAGHHGTERVIVPVLGEYLRARAEQEKRELEVVLSRINTDPFLYF